VTVKAYKRALRKAGLRTIKFHGLRHSFGTLAVQAFPLSEVQAWMGHADIHTTMRYVWYVPKHDAAERLGRLLDGENVAPNLTPNASRQRSRESIDHG
jgi:integrase